MKGPATATQCDCNTRRPVLSLTIRAEKSAIEPVVQRLVAFAVEHLPGAEEKHLQIDLALQEAVANAVVHGCKADATLEIKCWASFQAERGVLFVISDPGPGFIPAEVPDPMQEENLSFDHGRGVFLIRQLMDEVHYQKNGSEIHMIKY
jgi:serine/threonine-protein kinase RsbW